MHISRRNGLNLYCRSMMGLLSANQACICKSDTHSHQPNEQHHDSGVSCGFAIEEELHGLKNQKNFFSNGCTLNFSLKFTLIHINMFNQTTSHLAPARRNLILRYLAYVAALNLVWEILQLRLYTLWSESSPYTIGFAVVHCTLGDVLIAAFALATALVVFGIKRWPCERYRSVALMTGAIGVTYTVFSEWNNTVVTRTWAYSTLIPTFWGIGLSPILQWLLIPTFVFWNLSKRSDS